MVGNGGSIGDELRQLRGTMSQRELGRRTGIHNTTLRRYEIGQLTPGPDAMVKILDVLDVQGPERERLLAMVRRYSPGELIAGMQSGGQQLIQLIGYERAATRITSVTSAAVPGILQTRDYARAVLVEGSDTDRRVRMRMERAEILTRAEDPVELHVIVHTEALTRPVAPAAVIREQMRHLLRMAKLPNVTIQAVQGYESWWIPHLGSPFVLIEFPEEAPIVHIEHYRGGAFIWADVRSYAAAADEIAEKAMTPARSAEVIQELEQSL